MLVTTGNRQPIDEILMMALAGGSTGDDRKKRAFGLVEQGRVRVRVKSHVLILYAYTRLVLVVIA